MDRLVQAAPGTGAAHGMWRCSCSCATPGCGASRWPRSRVRHLDGAWGLRGVGVKGGTTRDIPVPATVMRFLQTYVQDVLASQADGVTAATPLFWSSWGRRVVGQIRHPKTGKNIWRLCKVYGRRIGAPALKPHDLRHGVAMEVLGARKNLEEVRAPLGHTRLETTQIYTTIRPAQLKDAVAFYEAQAQAILGKRPETAKTSLRKHWDVLHTGLCKPPSTLMVALSGFETRVMVYDHVFAFFCNELRGWKGSKSERD